jgi:hypothetical protein
VAAPDGRVNPGHDAEEGEGVSRPPDVDVVAAGSRVTRDLAATLPLGSAGKLA